MNDDLNSRIYDALQRERNAQIQYIASGETDMRALDDYLAAGRELNQLRGEYRQEVYAQTHQ